MQNFNSDLSKVSDLPLSGLEKTVTATVFCFNSNPEFLSSYSDKSVVATRASSLNSCRLVTDSNLNTAGQSLVQYLIAIAMMLKLIGQKHYSFLT